MNKNNFSHSAYLLYSYIWLFVIHNSSVSYWSERCTAVRELWIWELVWSCLRTRIWQHRCDSSLRMEQPEDIIQRKVYRCRELIGFDGDSVYIDKFYTNNFAFIPRLSSDWQQIRNYQFTCEISRRLRWNKKNGKITLIHIFMIKYFCSSSNRKQLSATILMNMFKVIKKVRCRYGKRRITAISWIS